MEASSRITSGNQDADNPKQAKQALKYIVPPLDMFMLARALFPHSSQSLSGAWISIEAREM